MSSNQDEFWVDIPSWQDLYQASSEGRIRSVERKLVVIGAWGEYVRSYGGYLLSPKEGDGGYLYVNLWKGNKGHMRAVHRLVCEAFSGCGEGLVCNHLDFNKKNNSPQNLEFVTQKQNVNWSKQHGRY